MESTKEQTSSALLLLGKEPVNGFIMCLKVQDIELACFYNSWPQIIDYFKDISELPLDEVIPVLQEAINKFYADIDHLQPPKRWQVDWIGNHATSVLERLESQKITETQPC